MSARELTAAEERLGLSLPAAFREWYERYGARGDVWSLQDRLLLPDDLRVSDGVLTFCVENQGVVRWGIRLDDRASEDPPVIVSHPGGTGWLVESPTTSAFAVHLVVLNTKWSDGVSYRANGQGTDEAFEAIGRTFPRLGFPDAHWPSWPTRLYGNEDLVIETNACTWIWVSARSAAALAQVDSIVRAAGMGSWDSYEGGREPE